MTQPLPKLVISREEIRSIKVDIREWSREKRELFIDKVRIYLNPTSQKTVENHLATFLGANYWYINSELYMSHGMMLQTFNSTSQGKQVVWEYPTANSELILTPEDPDYPEAPIHAAIHNLQDDIEGDEVEMEEVVVFEGYDKEAVDRYIRKEFGKKHLKLFQHVMKHS